MLDTRVATSAPIDLPVRRCARRDGKTFLDAMSELCRTGATMPAESKAILARSVVLRFHSQGLGASGIGCGCGAGGIGMIWGGAGG